MMEGSSEVLEAGPEDGSSIFLKRVTRMFQKICYQKRSLIIPLPIAAVSIQVGPCSPLDSDTFGNVWRAEGQATGSLWESIRMKNLSQCVSLGWGPSAAFHGYLSKQ